MSDDLSPAKKSMKRYLIVCTGIYVILFPFLFYIALLSSMIFDNSGTPSILGALIIFIIFWIPLSIPLSIYLMWSRYFRQQYAKIQFFSGLPLFTFGGVFFIIDVIPLLYRTIHHLYCLP